MGLLFAIIGYVLDYKNDKENFFKELAIGLAYFIGNLILAVILITFFEIHFLYCIFGFAIEILFLFSLKAYLQHKDI